MRKKELLARIEELEKAVTLLELELGDLKHSLNPPIMTYEYDGNDELPCETREDIAIANPIKDLLSPEQINEIETAYKELKKAVAELEQKLVV